MSDRTQPLAHDPAGNAGTIVINQAQLHSNSIIALNAHGQVAGVASTTSGTSTPGTAAGDNSAHRNNAAISAAKRRRCQLTVAVSVTGALLVGIILYVVVTQMHLAKHLGGAGGGDAGAGGAGAGGAGAVARPPAMSDHPTLDTTMMQPAGPVAGKSSIVMIQRSHGTCTDHVQSSLRWQVDEAKADEICCYNRQWAEYRGYWKTTQFYTEYGPDGTTTSTTSPPSPMNPVRFYDSVTGKLLFTAPVGRTWEEFLTETAHHGWPSFRDAEVNWSEVRVLEDGETVSTTGTHLGHNLPDDRNRYCINLISVSGHQSNHVNIKDYGGNGGDGGDGGDGDGASNGNGDGGDGSSSSSTKETSKMPGVSVPATATPATPATATPATPVAATPATPVAATPATATPATATPATATPATATPATPASNSKTGTGVGVYTGSIPRMGSETLMSSKAHGTCQRHVQTPLRWSVDNDNADRICCYNRDYAEFSGYWRTTGFLAAIAPLRQSQQPMEFYDSVTGKLLFTAPVGRTWEEFLTESTHHGWPSFRDAEVNWEEVRTLPGGETVSTAGTHLGHNLPDDRNRYCINLISVSGQQGETMV